jgi:hypothetical protein
MHKIEIEHKYRIGEGVYYINGFYSEVHKRNLRTPLFNYIKKISFNYESDKPLYLRYTLENEMVFREEELFESSFQCRNFIEGKN